MGDRQIWVSKSGSNSNSGSSSSPLKTIQAAIDRASGGDDIMVKAGTYVENVRIRKDDISLISADGNHDATIKAASQGRAAISGFGVEGIKIKGFEIDGPSGSNAVHFGMSGRGFKDPIRDLTIQDNKIHSSGLDGIKVSQAYNVKVLNNDVSGSGEEGIDFVAVNNSRIAGNDVFGSDGPSALGVKGGSSNVKIENNTVWDAKGAGISVGGWTTDKWMWPNARSYEAKDLTVVGNEVRDVGKAAILVSGARESHIGDNYLDPDNGQKAAIWVDRSKAAHPSPIYSKDISIEDNFFESSKLVQVNKGNGGGLDVSGNSAAASGQKGVWASARSAGDVAGASNDAAPDMIAVARDDLPEGYDLQHGGDLPDVRIVLGDESVIYTPIRDGDFDVTDLPDGAVSADDYLFFEPVDDTADSAALDDAAAILTGWHALDEAAQPELAGVDQASSSASGWVL
ncbi:right-handed parallel beta-helix repeat-containing protein [Skermanella mucosa]|uniref:right-handed parallel beta-helix repeat-containing protein n=1 Tax=Skermanella mucosa TaxID=1789672 RepID=UPI00192B8E0C|nr:right-handed parallel beta-helix repeat-containing protein [Skermanella mucosa]UEM18833.1 right-handed parallel beta-helix repeat-containing protein [Skermanella mucosa]